LPAQAGPRSSENRGVSPCREGGPLGARRRRGSGDGETRTRTGDTTIFSRVLYQLSYLAAGGDAIGSLRVRPARAGRASVHAMRRLLTLAAATAATFALAACGSTATNHSARSSPEQTELSYFPAGSPLLIAIQTSSNSAAAQGLKQLEDGLPIAALGFDAAQSRLSQLGINLDSDLRPLLGDPIVLGVTSSTIGHGSAQLLAVWHTRSAAKLTALLRKLPGVQETATQVGDTFYSFSRAALAQDGPTLLVGSSRGELQAALMHHPAHSAQPPLNVPPGAALTVFGNLGATLAQGSPSSRRVPWVDALTSYLTTLGATGSGLDLSFRLDTTGRSLTPAQVPLAAGNGTPSFAGDLPVTVSVLDPAHLLAFAEQTQAELAPESYARFLRRQQLVQARTGTNLNALLAQATGDLILASNLRTYLLRVGVSDPARAAADLGKLLSAPQSLFKQGASARPLGGGFYTVSEGGDRITLGIARGQFVAGFSRPASATVKATALPTTPLALSAFAAAPTTPASGAHGTVAFRVALPTLLAVAMHHQPPAMFAPVLQALGDVTGWASATTSSLTGGARLAVH
jgi:hypothetical protein